jgi:hypothetical protein
MLGQEERPRACAGGQRCRLGPGMTAADDDDMIGVNDDEPSGTATILL